MTRTDTRTRLRRVLRGRRPATAALAFALGATVLAGCDKASSGSANPSQNATAKKVTLTLTSNSIAGGKNAQEADWYVKYVIPEFTKQEKAKGVDVTLTFQPSGVDDEQYKSKVALDLKSRTGADVMALDGIWVGEFAQAGYIKPLADVVGGDVTKWDGWSQIPKAIQANASFEDKLYGIPAGGDGRVIYFNKKIFAKAGLPADWQPKSWDEILQAAEKLKSSVPGVTPIQLNAGTAMGEATTMQGVLPLLVGAGKEIWADGKWQGDTPAVRDVLGFYKQLIDKGLEDKNYQLAAKGRDESFAAFAAGKIGILLEGDYFWRSVINPDKGDAPMKTRDSDVGYALIPAKTKGSGIRGQDVVSMSGGGGNFLNPNTKYPKQAWELLAFMNSPDAIKAMLGGSAKITARQDVNTEVLSKDPLLGMISSKLLPLTAYRPGLAVYPQVSQALQQATADVIAGKSVADASKAYGAAVQKLAGGADKVASS
jgi:multiple sugar transport system substrate-binding protein